MSEEEVDIVNIWYKLGEILAKMETRILDRLDLLVENQLTKNIFESKFGIQPEETKIDKISAKVGKKEEDYILKNTKVKFETEKAYLIQNKDDLVAWIPKKCMKSIDTIKNTAVVHGWFKEKVQFNEEEPFES